MDQVLHECGITSTFIHGSEVPIWFEYRTKGSHIAFSLPTPSHLDEKISWFNLCIVFSLVNDQIFEFLPRLSIFNETKDIRRVYLSSFIGIPKINNNTMMWLIRWPAMDFQLEGGNTLSFSVLSFHLDIREFGITCESEKNIRYESDFRHYYPGMSMIARDYILYTNDLIC